MLNRNMGQEQDYAALLRPLKHAERVKYMNKYDTAKLQ